MTNARITGTGVAAVLLLSSFCACESERPSPAASSDRALAAAAAPSSEPMAELAVLDKRKPVPLLPMMALHQKQSMMEHLVAIQRITDGLAHEDWAEVVRASALMETTPQMQRMCRHMGAGTDGFSELALEFHRRAEAIGEAARLQDRAAALRATSDTLKACTGCHAAFRQEVVDSATWQARTGEAHRETAF